MEKTKVYKKGEDYFSDPECTDQLVYDDAAFFSCMTGEEISVDDCEIIEV